MSHRRNKHETSPQWRARMMEETKHLTKPGEILDHLTADMEKNGRPPKPTAEELRAAAKKREDEPECQ